VAADIEEQPPPREPRLVLDRDSWDRPRSPRGEKRILDRCGKQLAEGLDPIERPGGLRGIDRDSARSALQSIALGPHVDSPRPPRARGRSDRWWRSCCCRCVHCPRRWQVGTPSRVRVGRQESRPALSIPAQKRRPQSACLAALRNRDRSNATRPGAGRSEGSVRDRPEREKPRCTARFRSWQTL